MHDLYTTIILHTTIPVSPTFCAPVVFPFLSILVRLLPSWSIRSPDLLCGDRDLSAFGDIECLTLIKPELCPTGEVDLLDFDDNDNLLLGDLDLFVWGDRPDTGDLDLCVVGDRDLCTRGCLWEEEVLTGPNLSLTDSFCFTGLVSGERKTTS